MDTWKIECRMKGIEFQNTNANTKFNVQMVNEFLYLEFLLSAMNFKIKKQVRRGTYRESENLLRSIDIW